MESSSRKISIGGPSAMTARHYSQAEIDAVLALAEYANISHELKPPIPRYPQDVEPADVRKIYEMYIAAPKMAAIIHQQQEEIAHLKELLDLAHHNARMT